MKQIKTSDVWALASLQDVGMRPEASLEGQGVALEGARHGRGYLGRARKSTGTVGTDAEGAVHPGMPASETKIRAAGFGEFSAPRGLNGPRDRQKTAQD